LNGNVFIHDTALVDDGAVIGKGTKIWHFCHVMSGAQIGERCVLGQNVFVGGKSRIGNNVHIQNNVSVYDLVTLEDNVFCGPSAVFTNVINPRAEIRRNIDEYRPTLVKHGATIGANATVVCGHIIGRYALVGAGSVVTKDVPDYALVYGNATRIAGWVCECGEKLSFTQENANSSVSRRNGIFSSVSRRNGIFSSVSRRNGNTCDTAQCIKCEKQYEKRDMSVKRILKA
jgi:UDP-2-acetamido-3-amino-2,3-dideoxy-glucuronate N-acetyltransferase